MKEDVTINPVLETTTFKEEIMYTTTLRLGIRVLLTISFLVIVGCSGTYLSHSFIKKNPEISNIRDQLTESEAVNILRSGLFASGRNISIKEINTEGITFSVTRSEVVSINYGPGPFGPGFTSLKQTTQYRVWSQDSYLGFRHIRYISFKGHILDVKISPSKSTLGITIGASVPLRNSILAAFLKLCPDLILHE